MELALMVFGALVTGTGVLQWQGRLGQSRDVDALTERTYLCVPFGVAMFGFGLLFLFGDRVMGTIVAPIFALVYLLAAIGFVLMMVRPQRLRPKWQQAIMERENRPTGWSRG